MHRLPALAPAILLHMANLPLIRGSRQTNLGCLTEGSGSLIMAKKHTDITEESIPLFTRREMLGVAGMAGFTALAGMTPLAGSRPVSPVS